MHMRAETHVSPSAPQVDSKGLNDERVRQLALEVSSEQTDQLQAALQRKRCLIILDGALHADKVDMLLSAMSGRQQTLLFTTRRTTLAREARLCIEHSSVPEAFARFIAPLPNCVPVEPMCPGSAMRLLSKQFPHGAKNEIDLAQLAEVCEYIPRGLVEAIDMVCKGRFDLAGAATYVKETAALKRFFRPSSAKWEREWDTITLLAPIGGGASGKVHHATCTELASIDLAAKVMNHDVLDPVERRSIVKMLSTEVQALARINHPNVVRMFGVSGTEPRLQPLACVLHASVMSASPSNLGFHS